MRHRRVDVVVIPRRAFVFTREDPIKGVIEFRTRLLYCSELDVGKHVQ